MTRAWSADWQRSQRLFFFASRDPACTNCKRLASLTEKEIKDVPGIVLFSLPCDNGISGVVGTEPTQESSSSDARSAHRITGERKIKMCQFTASLHQENNNRFNSQAYVGGLVSGRYSQLT